MTMPAVPRDTLAMRVHIARTERKLSQRAAALKCGLTFGEWQGIEDGRDARGIHLKVEKIATGLGYSRDWLMWGGPLDGSEDPINRRYDDANWAFFRPAA
jgi:transcriptional regulator with XRE-family HTH domain